MVAIKILRAKEEEEENVNYEARGHISSKSAVFLPKSLADLHFLMHGEFIPSKVSLKLPESRLSETTFFILKKASRLGETC